MFFLLFYGQFLDFVKVKHPSLFKVGTNAKCLYSNPDAFEMWVCGCACACMHACVPVRVRACVHVCVRVYGVLRSSSR